MSIKKTAMPGKSEGRKITRADLPAAGRQRWVVSRKAAIVQAIAEGVIPAEEAMATYDLSEEELDGWTRAVSTHGVAALRTTRIQTYRQPCMPSLDGEVLAAENDAARSWADRAPPSGCSEG